MTDQTTPKDNRSTICCGACGRRGVRLYRPYASFRRPADDRCNACLQAPEATDWMIPLCMDADEDGTVWGYTSVPAAVCEWFYALPEAANAPGSCVWKRRGEEGQDFEGWGTRGKLGESILDKHRKRQSEDAGTPPA